METKPLDVASFITIVVLASQYFINNVYKESYLSERAKRGRTPDQATDDWNRLAYRVSQAVLAALIVAVLLGAYQIGYAVLQKLSA